MGEGARKMIELETEKNDTAEERAHFQEIVEGVTKARWSLQLLKGIAINGSASDIESVGSSRPETPLSTAPPSKIPQKIIEGNASAQLVALQQTHTVTLADLSIVTTKYHDTLWDIQDLSSQLKEVKLSQDLAASESPERNGSLDPFLGNTPGSTRRKVVRNTSENSGNCHLFFFFLRNAASTESLHPRLAGFSDVPSNGTGLLTGFQQSFMQVALVISITLAGAVLSQIAQTLVFQQPRKQQSHLTLSFELFLLPTSSFHLCSPFCQSSEWFRWWQWQKRCKSQERDHAPARRLEGA
jgi:hypothetical protein